MAHQVNPLLGTAVAFLVMAPFASSAHAAPAAITDDLPGPAAADHRWQHRLIAGGAGRSLRPAPTA